MMAKEYVMENNKIGSAILYFRETYQISQSKLGKGLCSATTLSRIEAGERDVDALLLEALLERLGKTPNQFELILTDFDYVLYQSREEIKKKIEEKNYQEAVSLLNEYEKIAPVKSSVHMQFITTCKALLNELHGGAAEDTIELFMEAISCTVPDFRTNAIKDYSLKDYYLSNSELNIIIDVIQRIISARMVERARELLIQILEYLDLHNTMEESNSLYSRVAVIASKLYMREQDMNNALIMSNKGLEKNKGSRKMDYIGELFLIKAQATEALHKKTNKWISMKDECLKLYMHAYFIFQFCEEMDMTEKLKKYLKEEYQWEDID
jgi:transcriptional regulator with XRE-family HTH domain